MHNDQLLTTSEAATYLSVSKAFLERDRWSGPAIPYVRVGTRTVRYRQRDLDDYVQARANVAAPRQKNSESRS